MNIIPAPPAPRCAISTIVFVVCAFVAGTSLPTAQAQSVEGDPYPTAAIDSSGSAILHAELPAAPPEGRSRFLRWSYRDAGAMIEAMPARTPVYLAAGAAVLIPGSLLDEPILGEIQENRSPLLHSFLDAVNPLGGPGMAQVSAGIFGASLLTENERLQDAAFTSMQSVVYAAAITYAIKYTAGRFRPEEGFGAHRFDAFSKNTSFPSGHTAVAFAVMTPWVMYYPHPVTYSLFGLSAGTAVARIAKDRHWPTDVLVGGTIGYLTGRYLAKLHMGTSSAKAPEPRLAFTPMIGPSGASFSLRLNLD